MKKVAVIGNGGLAREIMCRLKPNSYDVFVSESCLQKQDRGKVQSVESMDVDKYQVLICIGDSGERKRIVRSLSRHTDYFTFIDKGVRILDKDTVNVGRGSIITSGAILTTNIRLGDFSHVNLNTTIGHDVTTRDFFTTGPGVHVSGNTTIGESVYLATGSVVRNKVSICDHVTVGMNGVVTKDITESGIYVGIPAKKMK